MKKIFYYTDVLPFLSKEMAAINKLKRNLDTFKEASNDIVLVWHPYAKTLHYLELNKSPVINDYKKILNRYMIDKTGILDESDSFFKARQVLLDCDAYYGDYSDIISFFTHCITPCIYIINYI